MVSVVSWDYKVEMEAIELSGWYMKVKVIFYLTLNFHRGNAEVSF